MSLKTTTIGIFCIMVISALYATHRSTVPSELAYQRLRVCVEQNASTPYYGLERLHRGTTLCYEDFMKLKVDGDQSAFGNFNACLYSLGNPMYDLPPEETTEDFRKDMFHCLQLYPS